MSVSDETNDGLDLGLIDSVGVCAECANTLRLLLWPEGRDAGRPYYSCGSASCRDSRRWQNLVDEQAWGKVVDNLFATLDGMPLEARRVMLRSVLQDAGSVVVDRDGQVVLRTAGSRP